MIMVWNTGWAAVALSGRPAAAPCLVAAPSSGLRTAMLHTDNRIHWTSRIYYAARKALCFTTDVFFCLFRHEIAELPQPITAKLCHVVGIWVRFTIQVQNSGPSPEKFALGKIWVDFDREHLRNERCPPISPNPKKVQYMGKCICFVEKIHTPISN